MYVLPTLLIAIGTCLIPLPNMVHVFASRVRTKWEIKRGGKSQAMPICLASLALSPYHGGGGALDVVTVMEWVLDSCRRYVSLKELYFKYSH